MPLACLKRECMEGWGGLGGDPHPSSRRLIRVASHVYTLQVPSLLVLFSVPLVVEDSARGVLPLERIDIEAEMALLRRSLRESGRRVPAAFEVATVDNFRALITRGDFSCLHFSGHGHPHALAFEDHCGAAHFIDIASLRRLMSAGGGAPSVSLVFVNCCHSDVAAQEFVDCGVRHVIASPLRLRDSAAAAFTRGLYMALAVGKSVADAFAIAKECVRSAPRMPAEEADKFVLLPAEATHDETIWSSAARHVAGGAAARPQHRGAAVAYPFPPTSPPTSAAQIPFPPEDFVGRCVDMYQVLHTLRRRRLVVLTAPPGVGKSALASAIARHQALRRSYADGVVYCSCTSGSSGWLGGHGEKEGGHEGDGARLQLEGRLDATEAAVDAGVEPFLALLTSTVGAQLDCAWDDAYEPATNDAAGGAFGYMLNHLREKEVLLVVDGVDALAPLPGFHAVLHEILTRTLHLRLLLTSASPLPTHVSLPVKVVHQPLEGLGAIDAARLFARRVGRPLAELLPRDAVASLEALAVDPLLDAQKGSPAALIRTAVTVSEMMRTRHVCAHEAMKVLPPTAAMPSE